MWMIPGIRASVYAIPVWVLVIWGLYRVSQARKAAQPALR
jgi:aromatic amino acid transport protein AroP